MNSGCRCPSQITYKNKQTEEWALYSTAFNKKHLSHFKKCLQQPSWPWYKIWQLGTVELLIQSISILCWQNNWLRFEKSHCRVWAFLVRRGQMSPSPLETSGRCCGDIGCPRNHFGGTAPGSSDNATFRIGLSVSWSHIIKGLWWRARITWVSAPKFKGKGIDLGILDRYFLSSVTLFNFSGFWLLLYLQAMINTCLIYQSPYICVVSKSTHTGMLDYALCRQLFQESIILFHTRYQ